MIDSTDMPPVFNRRADFVTRAIMLKGNEHQATPAVVMELSLLGSHLANMLMRHDSICFGLYGENMVLAVLLKTFGEAGLLSLLEQGAIKFSLQRTFVVHLTKQHPGLLPLQPMALNTPTHTDPEASIDDAFSRMYGALSNVNIPVLFRALRDAYVSPSRDFAPVAVRLAHEGYTAGRFAALGLPNKYDVINLPDTERSQLSSFADDLHHLAMVADMGMETLNESSIATVCDESLAKLAQAHKIDDAVSTIFRVENVPDLAGEFRSGALRTESVPTMRQHPSARKFRSWVRQVSTKVDASDIAREYVDAVTHKSKFFERRRGKILKTLTIAGLTTAAGAAIAGPVGAALGTAAGTAVSTAGDLAIDLIDEMVLDGLLKGWQPRSYFDDVLRPKLAKIRKT